MKPMRCASKPSKSASPRVAQRLGERAVAHHAHGRRDVGAELQEGAERIAGKQLEAGRGAEQTEDARRHVEHVRLGKSVRTGEVAAHRVHVVVRRRRALAVLEGVDGQHRDAGPRRGVRRRRSRSRGWH